MGKARRITRFRNQAKRKHDQDMTARANSNPN